MQEFIIPIVYYPLKILLVDDNPNVLTSLKNKFIENYKIQTALSGKEAIDIINNQILTKYDLFTDITESDLYVEQNEAQITKLSLNIKNILQLADDKDKYEKVGLLITDYNMPVMDGIELCTNIKNTPIRKILMTANMDINKAIKALNTQLIDCYIDKNEDGIVEELKYYINEVHIRYFNHLTALVSESLSQKRLTFLKDTAFSELFNKVVSEHNIKEHYLIDSNGSFLLVDDLQNRFVLMMHTDTDLDIFYEYFKMENNVISLLNGVKMRELIPFFGINVDPATVDIASWHRHFYSAKKYEGYYWNVIKIN